MEELSLREKPSWHLDLKPHEIKKVVFDFRFAECVIDVKIVDKLPKGFSWLRVTYLYEGKEYSAMIKSHFSGDHQRLPRPNKDNLPYGGE